jgi:hypothetical protein
LHPGDATFAKSFTKISRGDNGAQLSAGFKPPKGREFVVLLLGDVEKGQPWVDVEKMLNELGFYRKDASTAHQQQEGE